MKQAIGVWLNCLLQPVSRTRVMLNQAKGVSLTVSSESYAQNKRWWSGMLLIFCHCALSRRQVNFEATANGHPKGANPLNNSDTKVCYYSNRRFH